MCLKVYKLFCHKTELQLKGTLNGGQSFRWKNIKTDGKDEWIGVFNNRIWILQQFDEYISYQVIKQEDETQAKKGCDTEPNHERMLRDYFQLDYNLNEHYPEWSKCDPYFKEAAKLFYGIRILKQDVTENIFSFICSSNNNIARISSMVEKLAQFYGREIGKYGGVTYYAFPSVKQLSQEGVEQKLKENGFGYRARYIANTAAIVNEKGGDVWLKELKQKTYVDAKKALMELTGVGAKVADCICLMSLGHLQAIPVDTHIYQIAQRFYMPKLAKQKTVTERVYNEIGDHFRTLYGPLAGWAHTVLFCADLKKFQVDQSGNGKRKRTDC